MDTKSAVQQPKPKITVLASLAGTNSIVDISAMLNK
jgi:hypothetical protein